MARDVHATNGVRVWKTTNGNSTKLLHISSHPVAPILWDNTHDLMACMPTENIIRVWHGTVPYEFIRTSPSHHSFVASIHDGDIFDYRPWSGPCTAKWVDGELWMARDLNSTNGTCVWKTRNGDGRRLLQNGTVHILWDNCVNLVAFMPDPNTITVWHGDTTYNFTRQSRIVPIAEPICMFPSLLPSLPFPHTIP